MHKPYYILCLIRGVIKSTLGELKELDCRFFRVGFLHCDIEGAMESVVQFLTHVELTLSWHPDANVSGSTHSRDRPKFSILPAGLQHVWTHSDPQLCDTTMVPQFRFLWQVQIGENTLPHEDDEWFMIACEKVGLWDHWEQSSLTELDNTWKFCMNQMYFGQMVEH